MNSEAPKSPPSVYLLFKHLALLFGLSIVVLTLIFLLTEGIVVRKILTSLVLPAGCCWIGLILLTYFTLVFRRWWAGISSLLLTGIYTLSASPIVGGYLARPLEEPYRDFSIDRAENFDVLILLGGGTDFGFNRQPELGSSGDRVMVALQMYRAGKTKKLSVRAA